MNTLRDKVADLIHNRFDEAAWNTSQAVATEILAMPEIAEALANRPVAKLTPEELYDLRYRPRP